MPGCYQKRPLDVRYVVGVRAGGPGYDQRVNDEHAGFGSGFEALGLDSRLLGTLTGLGYEEPTPIQEAAIPPLLQGKDLLAEAPTGTGKTAAFALPILNRLAVRLDELRAAGEPVDGRGAPRRGERGSRPRWLVLAPTRELAMQVAEATHKYGRELGTRVVPVYGGQPITAQLHRLARGVDVVVATPGRAVDHLERGSIRLDEVETVVLDEADEMLDMGFADDLERILGSLPELHQTALFSATISGPIARLASRHLRHPVEVRVQAEAAAGDTARVRQVAYVVRRADKLAALGRILDLEDGTATLVFARTRGEVDDLAEALSGRGRDAAALHGGLAQEQRDRIMGRFREGALDVLVATDVAARGLDIEQVSHVVNYDVPSSPDTYVHRIGRTGRAGRAGVAITLVEPREHRLLRDIERSIGAPLEIVGLPTVADVREKRMDLLRGTLRETLLGDGFDRYRAVVEPLSEEFDVVDIALAAISLADEEARGAEDTVELAPATLPAQGGAFDAADRRRRRPKPAVARGAGFREAPTRRRRPAHGPSGEPARRPGADAGPAGDGDRPPRPRRPSPHPAAPARGLRISGWRDTEGRPVMRAPRRTGGGDGFTRLFVGAGRAAGMRPGDLVGAITNEAGLRGADVGAIQIAEGFSLVEVPDGDADRVIRALRGATIRGQKVNVRRERY
jgi:ATP-dependent RNA helicase DeaD